MPKVLDDEKIYRAVIQAVSKGGYSGTTTKKMATAAGISEVTLFRKYGSKQQIVKEAISFIIEQSDLRSATQYTGDVHADLTRLVKLYHDMANEYGDFASVVLFEMVRHPGLFDFFDEPFDIFLSFTELISRYQKEGILVEEPPLFALASLVSPVIMAFNMTKVIPNSKLEIEDLTNHVHNFLTGRSSKTNKPL